MVNSPIARAQCRYFDEPVKLRQSLLTLFSKQKVGAAMPCLLTPFWLICTVCTVRLDTLQNIEAAQQIRAQESLHKTVVQATESRRQITFPSLKKVPCTFVLVNHVTKPASLCAILECEFPHIVIYLVSSIGTWTKALREVLSACTVR